MKGSKGGRGSIGKPGVTGTLVSQFTVLCFCVHARVEDQGSSMESQGIVENSREEAQSHA